MDPTREQIVDAALFYLGNFIEPDQAFCTAVFEALTFPPGYELDDWQVGLTWALRPRDEDYARVFVGEAAAIARAAYAPMWEQPGLAIRPRRGQTDVSVTILPAASLATDPAAGEFPGGYRQILDKLVPDRLWGSWEFIAPGERGGMQYTGLVYLEGRFVWFPKPWQPFAT